MTNIAISPIPPYIPAYLPISDVTPLTYRDGTTYLNELAGLKDYLNGPLADYVNATFATLGDEFNAQVNTLITTVNGKIVEFETEYDTDRDAQNTLIDGKVTDLTTFVNDSIATIINSTIAVTDPVTLAIVENAASATRLWFDGQYGTKAKQDATALIIPAGSTAAQAQAILTSAAKGQTVKLAPTADIPAPVGGFVFPADAIVFDLAGGRVTQATWASPAFDTIGRSYITVRNGTIEYTGGRQPIAGNIRGSANYVSTAAVWGNGDGIRVENNTIKNFVCGAFFSSWDGANLNAKYSNGNRFIGNDVSGHDFGVLYTAQNHFRIQGNTFHDDIDSSAGANPTHSIYGSSTTLVRSTDVSWIDNKTYNQTHGQAYQGKYDDKLRIRNCSADTTQGLLNIIDCHDLDIDGMASTDDFPLVSGSVTIQSTDLLSQRPRVKNIDVKLRDAVNSRAFLLISQDGKYENLNAVMNPAAAWGGGAIYDIRGDNNTIVNSDGTNKNPAVAVIGLFANVGPACTNLKVRGGIFLNVTNVIQVGAGNNGGKFNVDSTVQVYTGSLYSVPAATDYSAKDIVPVALSTVGEHATLFALAKDTLTHAIANSGYQVKVRPSRDIQVSNLIWYCVTPSGNYDIGIFDDTTGAVLFTKGTTPAPAAGKVNEAVAPATPAIMRAGRVYRLTISADNNVLQYRGISAPVAGIDTLLSGGTNATTVAAIFPLPTNTLAAGATATPLIPLIIVLGTKPTS